MIALLFQGHVELFLLLVIALVISLSFHEFGHAWVARLFGDDTAERAGRLTLNPLVHIDPLGLIMVMVVGFGYARPVPVDPRNFRNPRADLFVAAAGPAMNLVLAFLTVNLFLAGLATGYFSEAGPRLFFLYLAQINLLLMLFNLIPLGALDGHYILPHFLPRELAYRYRVINARYGNYALLALIALSLMGVPVFQHLMAFSGALLPWIVVV